MRCSGLAVGVLAAALAPPDGAPARADGPLAIRPGTTDEWVVTCNGTPVCVYRFALHQKKPYVLTLATPDGEDVLREAPPDHLHHHGLMYAIRADGVNFWEETPGTGVQKPVGTPTSEVVDGPDGSQEARFTQRLHWVAEADAGRPDTETVALLIEDRTLAVSVDAGRDAVRLAWHAEFRPGPGREQVVLTGSNYNGLGMRFRADLDPVAGHVVAGAPLDLSDRKQLVTPGPWAAVRFRAPDRPLTVALVGAPGNARGPAGFFAMREPFAYLSATQGLDREPLVYRAGERVALDYLVTVAPGLAGDESLDRLARDWAASRAAGG